MSGRFSRNKGRREEQQLVLALVNMGYTAERILRQYFTPGEADVKTLTPKQYTFELKTRHSSFKTLYDIYYAERDHNGVLAFMESVTGTAVALSTSFPTLEKNEFVFKLLDSFPKDNKLQRALKRLIKLKDLKQTADFLVIKDNNKPRLYLRYWR